MFIGFTLASSILGRSKVNNGLHSARSLSYLIYMDFAWAVIFWPVPVQSYK